MIRQAYVHKVFHFQEHIFTNVNKQIGILIRVFILQLESDKKGKLNKQKHLTHQLSDHI